MSARGTIELTDVHKSFPAYSAPTVKHALVWWATARGRRERREVLRGIDLRVEPGERVGLVGNNGVGKSTLFRVISRIMRADRGQVKTTGRVSPLIELTAGLVPDLTGRDNLVLNAAVLGLSRAEIDERLDDIVAFAGLEEFMDTPVRYFSSGMRARLGFSIAVHVDADILLIDEALAVGDQDFQARCIDRMRAIGESGTTVLFVSHEFEMIRRFCPRVVWLENGRVRQDGECNAVLAAASRTIESDADDEPPAAGEGASA
jgi:ABC-2 type transport system ATP-binding protein